MSDEERTDFHTVEVPSAPAPAVRVWGSITLLLILLAVAAGYAWHEHDAVQRLATQNRGATSSLDAARAQVADLTARLNDMTERSAAQPVKAATSSRPSPIRRAVSRRTNDPVWKEIHDQLAREQKQIDAGRVELASTRTELQGSIARTHDELVLLERKAERNYYEFDIDKNGQFQRKGPVGIRLRKANTKHQYADLELMVDDVKLSQKHVNLYQPVVFYGADSKQPAELVINTIAKNHIHGYVSGPKYEGGEVEATADASGKADAGSGLQRRQRLQSPTN
jgi:hypothetical protein